MRAPDQINLRAITPADGPAVAALSAAAESTTGGPVRSRLRLTPEAVAATLKGGAVGVAAEAHGAPQVVGMGWMLNGRCQYEGAWRPYAYLYNGVVHPAYRGRRILAQLSAWRIEQARAQFGPDVVAFALVANGNLTSQKAVGRWAGQRVERRMYTAIAAMRARPPRPPPGVEVRAASEADLIEGAQVEDTIYAGYNFYPARQGGASSLGGSAEGSPPSERWVAVGRGGVLLAGIEVADVSGPAPVRVEGMSWPARLGNLALRLIPPDGVVRLIRIRNVWYRPGGEAAAAYLCETARWRWRDRGTTLTARYDALSPLARIFPRSRLIPRRGDVLFVAGPAPLQEVRPIYLQHL